MATSYEKSLSAASHPVFHNHDAVVQSKRVQWQRLEQALDACTRMNGTVPRCCSQSSLTARPFYVRVEKPDIHLSRARCAQYSASLTPKSRTSNRIDLLS